MFIFPATYSFSDLLSVLLLGLTANILLGGFVRKLRHISIFSTISGIPEKFILTLEKRLNRQHRSELARRIRGWIFVIFMAAISLLLALSVHEVSLLFPYGALIYILLIALLIRPRSLFDIAYEIAKSLDILGLEPSRELISPLIRRDDAEPDIHTANRATIEYLAENFADKVISPAMWFLLFGLSGLFFSRLINEGDATIGHRSSRFAAFGAATAATDSLLNLIPARIGGILLALAAIFVPRCHPVAAFKVMLRQARNFVSVNSGWTIAAMAGALGLTLGGMRAVEKVIIKDGWVGNGSAKATTNDLRRAAILFAVATLLLVICGALGLWFGLQVRLF